MFKRGSYYTQREGLSLPAAAQWGFSNLAQWNDINGLAV